MNWKKMALAGLVLLSSTVTVAATGVDGQAASYRRTKMTKISHKDYYSLSKKGWTYKISGSVKHARLKRNHHLINYTTSTWQRSKRTYLYKHGKKTCYYYVKNTKNGATGWVWSGYLKAGKNYQATTAKKVATKTYYRNPQRAGKFYQLKGSNRYVRFTTGRALKTNTAYRRSRQRTVYKKGKKVTYYFIKQGKQSGWVWSKYLTTQVPTARLGITKRGRTVAGVTQYQASGNVMVPYQTKNFSTVSVPHAYMMQKFTYQPAANYHELKTLQPTANVFETTNPQSAAFSKDDHYLYVMYVTSSDGNSDHQRGWVVRYDWQRLTALGARKNGQMALVRQAALDQYHQRATSQLDRDVLACIKIGPRFTTGHAQSMALNPKTNELWFVQARTGQAQATVKRLNQTTLKPDAAVNFTLKSTLHMGSVLAFDNAGRAYYWTKTVSPWKTAPRDSAKIYRGILSTKQVHFELVMQGLRYAPGSVVQSMAYNAQNKRLYLVASGSIFSVPTSKLGHLRPSDVGLSNFNGHREFEGLTFSHRDGHGFVLTNRGPELMQFN